MIEDVLIVFGVMHVIPHKKNAQFRSVTKIQKNNNSPCQRCFRSKYLPIARVNAQVSGIEKI